MNKTNIWDILKRKLLQSSFIGGDELLKRRVVKDMVSNYTYQEVEAILRKEKPIYYNTKSREWIYLI
jgi:hypothetical protein